MANCKNRELSDLKEAISLLKSFVNEQQVNSLPQKKLILLKNNPLVQLVKLHLTKQNRVEATSKPLTHAIEQIKRHHRLLERLTCGSEEEAGFAIKAKEAIEGYNRLISQSSSQPNTLTARIRRFLLGDEPKIKGKKIFLPTPAKLSLTNSSQPHSSILDTFEQLPHPPKSAAVDLFRMKIIREIEDRGLLSIGQTLREVRSAPIDAVAVRSVKSGDLAGGSIASLRQTCIPLPGEKFHFSALFERGANSEIRGVPIGDITYHLTSQQTGFPDPALICGFGFCEELMPRLPLRPEVAPSLELLLNRKHEVAFALLPQGALNQKAKQLYSMQKQLFDQDRSYFITKHRAIVERILRLFEADEADLRRIKSYFQKLLQTAPDYDELSSLYRLLNEATIEAVATLENSLLSYDAMMDKPSLAVVEESLINGLNEEILPKIGDDTLLNTLQRTLVRPTARFILQSASEKHHFPPPTLTQAELRLQSAIFYQQIHFFQQLEDPQTTLDTAEILTASHSYFDTLLALLKGEKASTTGELALHLVEEVEGYYNSRYLESAV